MHGYWNEFMQLCQCFGSSIHIIQNTWVKKVGFFLDIWIFILKHLAFVPKNRDWKSRLQKIKNVFYSYYFHGIKARDNLKMENKNRWIWLYMNEKMASFKINIWQASSICQYIAAWIVWVVIITSIMQIRFHLTIWLLPSLFDSLENSTEHPVILGLHLLYCKLTHNCVRKWMKPQDIHLRSWNHNLCMGCRLFYHNVELRCFFYEIKKMYISWNI